MTSLPATPKERFFITGAGQTGRYDRKTLRQMVAEDRLEEVYAKAVLLEIDFASKQILRRFEIDRENMEFQVEGYATNFTVPAVRNGRALIPSHATVYEMDLRTFSVLSRISSPMFNDLHHVSYHGERLLAVSTGLERVVEFKRDASISSIYPVLPDLPPIDPAADYRTHHTKPHLSHPNYVFSVGEELWVTRAKQFDCVPLHDLAHPVPLSDVMVHDGILFDGLYYFTSVRGQVLVLDLERRLIVQEWNLIQKRWHLLTGWCRGIHVTEDFCYVAFSVFRRTRQLENIQWLKAKLTGTNPPLPTRIEKIDRKTGVVVDQFTFEPEELTAIFWIGEVEAPHGN